MARAAGPREARPERKLWRAMTQLGMCNEANMKNNREKGIRFFGDVLGKENEQGLREEIREEGHFGSETAKFSADFALALSGSVTGLRAGIAVLSSWES